MNRKQIKEILNKTDMVRFSCTPEEKAAAEAAAKAKQQVQV